ncbi:MAG: peptidase U32 family protein, partial [Lachnospiraceae bacterium]
MKKKIEILAPAGSYESLKAAVKAGADAVYIGGSCFGARAYADNLNEEKLLEAIDYVHLHDCKIYLTINTLLKEKEIEKQLYDYLLPYYRQGIDAVIVQDVGVLEFIKERFPDLPIHASTQMTITNVAGAKFLEEQGVERVVPARELNLTEIREIAEHTGLEVECFVHGALCYCYSGQCLFSSLVGGRSGNRGQCAQPCRLPYQVEGEKNPSYLLSLKDICTLQMIPEMVKAGITSFKIEGRMKKPEYVAIVTAMYRKYLDLYETNAILNVAEQDKEMLMDL